MLCCGNDKMALRVYGILRSMGRRVPSEISVAGDDNYRVIAETLYPPLTTVDLPDVVMGLRAAHAIDFRGNPGREGLTLVVGPVDWRASAAEMRPANISHLKTVRDE